MQEISARVPTVRALVLITLMLWNYVLCQSIDYFLPADARERTCQRRLLHRAVLTAALMSLASLLVLLTC